MCAYKFKNERNSAWGLEQCRKGMDCSVLVSHLVTFQLKKGFFLFNHLVHLPKPVFVLILYCRFWLVNVKLDEVGGYGREKEGGSKRARIKVGRPMDKESKINWGTGRSQLFIEAYTKAQESERMNSAYMHWRDRLIWHITMHPHITCTHPSLWSPRCWITYRIKATFLPLTQVCVSAIFGSTDSEKLNPLYTGGKTSKHCITSGHKRKVVGSVQVHIYNMRRRGKNNITKFLLWQALSLWIELSWSKVW